MEAPEQVRAVLVAAKAEGMDFERAWYNAIRAISPPRTCPPQLRAKIDELRGPLREAKPYFRAAYFDRAPTTKELRRGFSLAERRLDDLRLPTADALAEAVVGATRFANGASPASSANGASNGASPAPVPHGSSGHSPTRRGA